MQAASTRHCFVSAFISICAGEVWRSWLCLHVELCGAQDGGQRDLSRSHHPNDHHQSTKMADVCLSTLICCLMIELEALFTHAAINAQVFLLQ